MKLVPLENPVLRTPCLPVEGITPELLTQIRQMAKILRSTKAVGIAAPQVGLGIQVFLTDVPNDSRATPSLRINGKSVSPSECRPLAFINPQVKTFGEKSTEEEGCLSIPGKFLPVERPYEVRVEALSLDGKPMIVETCGFFARVIQHENDHLNGVLITDHQKEPANA